MRLLIVEDDQATLQMYHDNIEAYSRAAGIEITPDIKGNLNDAKEALKSPDYDAAIVDLKLSSDKIELEGKEIVDEINQNLRFPLFIVSGSIGQIETEENAFFKKRSRDDDFREVLKEITDIYNTGITRILGNKGDINDYLNKIFWNHLSTSLDVWINDGDRDKDEKYKSLLRYTLLHIQEYLELTEESDFEAYHPAEIYITPPIKARPFTGDIVMDKKNSEKHIILTPSCDMAQGKARDILLVRIESTNHGLFNEKINVIKKNKVSKDVLDEAEETVKRLITNSFSNKYHYLPSYKDINAGLINFQKLRTLRLKEFEENFNIIASINSSFTKDIVARFSYYYSRQGSPDFNVEEIFKSSL